MLGTECLLSKTIYKQHVEEKVFIRIKNKKGNCLLLSNKGFGNKSLVL